MGLKHIMRDIETSWDKLEVFCNQITQTSLATVVPYVQRFSIGVPSSWGEWHRTQMLGEIIGACTNLRRLELALSGSSRWLRYLPPNAHVEELVLRGSSSNSKPVLFDLNDLHMFRSVRVLKLEFVNLTRDYSSAAPSPVLFDTVTELSIFNCHWDFPFTLSTFRAVRVLNACYTLKCESFTFSERLRSLASRPPATLRRLTLHLNLLSPQRHKTWYPELEGCPELEFVSLKGFRYPGIDYFNRMPRTLRIVDLSYEAFPGA
ncbi:uncharacterized protein V1510DRAFT_392940 [Dipodascopsis tothii]|uniref:uncharacterized protein n=1 Tax=Dipodascopsis tothii TaxID=44089 RepID=UPI0034CF3897